MGEMIPAHRAHLDILTLSTRFLDGSWNNEPLAVLKGG
jgi:hypothetical protein